MEKKQKPVARAEEFSAIDFTKLYEITVLEPLRRGDLLMFDTEGTLIYKKKNVNG